MRTMNKEGFAALVCSALSGEALKKLVFSRPTEGEITKISCRGVFHRGRRLLAMEMSLPGNTVSHKNVGESEAMAELLSLLDLYLQANLITTAGEAEFKVNKKGEQVVLGGDALKRKLEGDFAFERAMDRLDKEKNYILSGTEDFLIKLGISSADGRVHDKKQGKFRQINRFLEHIEDVYSRLPSEGVITVYDLCCGKSYLSFAVYHYLTAVKGRQVKMLGADLKRDVIIFCEGVARELGYDGMHFEVADILKMDYNEAPDMVISLHACDIATDIVLDTAIRLGAGVILSTPCCHRYINGKITAGALKFVTDHPHLATKLGEALTDGLRILRLRAAGYSVVAPELTDPENTPKNTLIRAVKNQKCTEAERLAARTEYESALAFLLGEGKYGYLKGIIKDF